MWPDVYSASLIAGSRHLIPHDRLVSSLLGHLETSIVLDKWTGAYTDHVRLG
jgi:hypothetical protein